MKTPIRLDALFVQRERFDLSLHVQPCNTTHSCGRVIHDRVQQLRSQSNTRVLEAVLSNVGVRKCRLKKILSINTSAGDRF